ncbi:MAG: tetratricopeptide repeat protein [Pyrinomonadaceae bacterium]
MTRENLLFAIIGILLGFIVGFLFASSMSQRTSPATTAAVTANQNLPADHPQIPSGDTQNPQQTFAEVQAAIGKARSEPNNFEAQMKAAELFYQIQRYDQALEFLLKANQLKPDSFEAVVALGQVNLDAEHYDTAEKWYKAALLKKPDDTRVLASLAFTTLQKGDAREAEKAIASLEKIDPSNEDLKEFRERLEKLKSGEKAK